MTTDSQVSDLIINKLSLAKYIELKQAGLLQADQLYQITDPESAGGSTSWGLISGTLSNQTDLQNALNTKQATLVSGTNIKTVNSQSLLGSGDVNIDSLPSQIGQSGKYLTTNGTNASWTHVDITPDNLSITKDSNNYLQTVGVIDSNNTANAIKTWTGTKVQYDTIVTKDTNTEYFCTDTGELYLGSIKIGSADWSNNVTNCITEIPQDIKLELNNGVLTLKAGSKIYVPKGFESDGTTPKFDTIITTSDNSFYGLFEGKGMPVFCQYNNWTGFVSINNIYSGSTQPTPSGDTLWYDTENNVVKVYISNYSEWGINCALPFGIITLTSNSVTSIDQVFNGFGYIGSTVFALPGVKGLIPNGRNADGTLKNIEYTINSVKTFNQTLSETSVLNIYDGSIEIDIATYTYQNFFIQKNKPTQYQYMLWFDTSENIIKYTENTGASWTQINLFNCGKVVSTTNGVITSLTPKTAFHAVDYNDFNSLSNAVINSRHQIVSALPANPTPGVFYFVVE